MDLKNDSGEGHSSEEDDSRTALPKKILLVEDEAIIALAEAACLKRKGYSVITAPSGEKAIEVVHKDPSIDLILMDIDLGSGMDGTEAAKKILEHHDIPIIFLSAHNEGEIADRTFQIGSYGYILKNAGETVLLASLRMAFRLYDTHKKQQETEKRLFNLQMSYNSILRHAPVSILIVQNGNYTYANPYAASLLGYASPEELVGTPVLETIDPAYRQSIVERIHTIQHGIGNPPMRMKILRKDGTSLWTESVSIPMEFQEGPGALVIGRDITATVAMEEKLKREADLHAERLALVEYSFSHTLQEILQKTIDLVCGFTESPIGFFHFITEHSDGSQRIDLMAWSTATLERYCKITELSAHYPFPQAGVWADCARLKRPVIHNDCSKVLGKKGYPPGHPDILRELTVPIIRSGTCIAILGVGNKTSPYTEEDLEITARFADLAWEIVQRKNTELDLQRSEQEQRTLLLELRHRIKNSLNQIISLTSLQEDGQKDQAAREALRDIRNRVSVLAGLYESLYETGSHMVCLDRLIQRVCCSLVQAFSLMENVHIDCQSESVEMKAKEASAFGLILNELVTNAFKHGFPQGREGRIEVSFKREGEKGVLTVQDDGVGFNEDETVRTGAFGFELIKALVFQLRATLQVRSRASGLSGTRAVVTLPLA